MPTAADPALFPTARFEGSSIGTALLSYVTIANFSHNYKGKALAGSLTHAKSAPLPHYGLRPSAFPRISGPRDSRQRNDNRVSRLDNAH
jgi:hypothetical protein